MSNKKFRLNKTVVTIIIVMVSVLALVGIAIGAIYFYKQSKNDSSPIEVYSVSMLNRGYYDNSTLSGSIYANTKQSIYPNAALNIEEIYVKEGDTIKISDQLVKYDNTFNDLQLETERTSVELINSQIRQAEKKLEQLKSTTPVEDIPTTTEEPTTEEPLATQTDPILPVVPTTPQNPDENFDINGEDFESGEITYTKKELEDAIKLKEEEIRDLKLQYEMSALQYEINKNAVDNGVVLSKCNGVVEKVNDYETALLNNEPLIVIGGNTGYSMAAYVDEWQRASIVIGDMVSIVCYDNGMMYEGTIMEMSDIPSEGYGSQGTSSYYSVNINIETEDVIPQNAWGEVTLGNTNTNYADMIVLSKAYVKDENGAKYVMKEENGRLKKQYVKTGKTMWGTEIQILGGISMEDKIAFPFDKKAIEGKVVKDAEDPYGYY